MNNQRSLSSKLSLIILLLAVPIFIISLGLLFTQSRNMIRNEAMGRAKSVLSFAVQRMHRNIVTIETATNANASYIANHLHPDSILGLTHYIVSLNPDIDGCSVSMEPGVLPGYEHSFSAYTIREKISNTTDRHYPVTEGERDTISTVIEQPYDYFRKVWYKTPHDLDAPCWVSYFDEADSLELIISGMLASYGRPIHDASGRTIAIISTDISLKRLSKAISQEKPYPNSYFMMVNREGLYIAHPDTTRLFTHSIFDGADPRRQADIIALGHEMTKGNKGKMFLDIDGVPSLVTYQPVPGIAWSLALVCPDKDILEGYHQLTYLLVPLLIFGLLFILIICYNSVSHAIRPLNVLLKKTQQIASGNMDVHIPRSKRTDAIGKLQNSFASMLQRLNFHMGSVRYTTDQAQQRNEELVKATRMAEEADRQKTAFIQNVSHQIRTPLNIIMGFAQILSTAKLSNISDEDMAGITSTLDHNSKLLNRILAMLYDSSETGRTEELKCEKHDNVSCNELSKEVISFIKIHHPHITINFHTEVADSLCIHTNRLYLMLSLRELLYNSAKYSDGQHISLFVKMGNNDSRKTVCFIVEDTGRGIAEADLDLMFAFFTKVDDLTEGLGLGLPLSKRHILNLGGNLTYDNSYHDGCRFIIEMPL